MTTAPTTIYSHKLTLKPNRQLERNRKQKRDGVRERREKNDFISASSDSSDGPKAFEYAKLIGDRYTARSVLMGSNSIGCAQNVRR